jgi:hypothetical protein
MALYFLVLAFGTGVSVGMVVTSSREVARIISQSQGPSRPTLHQRLDAIEQRLQAIEQRLSP